MSEYQNLKPIFASSIMRISINNAKLNFSNVITYDYRDLKGNSEWKNYFSYLKEPANYNSELNLYWKNLQAILDEEINKINKNKVCLKIIHCTIQFRDQNHPFVQWIIEFEGDYNAGQNFYENYVEKEILEYPIYSLYIFQKPLIVSKVITSLNYKIGDSKRLVEYYGKPSDKLDGYEALVFH